ncbi:MAG: transglutaminaseTgpA domain-containing protein [Kibdelosporangium sp.]
MTTIRPQSAPAGPMSAGGNVTQTVHATQHALQHPKPPNRKRGRNNRQHIQQAGRGPRIRMGLSAYVQLVLVGVTVGTTSLAYVRYFSGPGFLISMLPAAAGGVLVGTLAAIRRWRAPATVGVAAFGFLVLGIFAVFRSTLNRAIPTWETLSSLGSGVVSGWAKMLSVTLPADPGGQLELTPALLMWIASVVSSTLVLRSKSLLGPILPPVLVFMAALPLTAARPAGGSVLVGVLLAEVLLLALVRAGVADPLARQVSTRTLWGRFLFGLPVVAVAVGAGLAGMRLVPLADGDERFDLRDVVPVQLQIDDNISPLSTLKAQLRKPDNTMFTVRLSGDTAGIDRIRTVSLNTFDGAMWSSKDKFLLSGHTLPADESLRNPRRVTANVTVEGLSGPYLPEVGAPVEIDGAPRVGFSEGSGTLATDQLSIAGLNYTLTTEVGRREGLDKSVPYVAEDAQQDTSLPEPVPAEIRAKGTELAGDVAEPYAKLLAIQKYMQSFPYNLDSRPGHSYDAMRRLFGPNLAEQVGYAEQFAASFAVLARSQGFPARVAVGYLLNDKNKDGDTYQVKSGDAHAWAEVNLAGHGWVAFEPTDPQRRPANAQQRPETETQAENNKPEQSSTASQPAEDPNLPKLSAGELSVLDWALFVLIGLGVLLLLVPIATGVEKFRRRRLRRSGSRAARIVGAWQQVTDRLIEHGIAVTGCDTPAEVSSQARERIGDKGTGSLAVLAPIVTAAVFDPAEPGDDAVKEAWNLESQLRRELRKARSPLLTIRAWLDPRPLFARWRDERRRRRAMDRLTRG